MTERLTFKLNTILPLIVVKLNFLLKYIYFKFKSKFKEKFYTIVLIIFIIL